MGAKAPEKGVFPIDHFGECAQVRGLCRVGLVDLTCRGIQLQPSVLTSPSPMTPPPQLVDAYLKCLKEHEADAQACRELSKRYLQCRMERWVWGGMATGKLWLIVCLPMDPSPLHATLLASLTLLCLLHVPVCACIQEPDGSSGSHRAWVQAWPGQLWGWQGHIMLPPVAS